MTLVFSALFQRPLRAEEIISSEELEKEILTYCHSNDLVDIHLNSTHKKIFPNGDPYVPALIEILNRTDDETVAGAVLTILGSANGNKKPRMLQVEKFLNNPEKRRGLPAASMSAAVFVRSSNPTLARDVLGEYITARSAVIEPMEEYRVRFAITGLSDQIDPAVIQLLEKWIAERRKLTPIKKDDQLLKHAETTLKQVRKRLTEQQKP